MKKIRNRFILGAIAAVFLAQTPAANKTSVAVYPIKASGVTDKAMSTALTSLLGYELTQSDKLIVIKEDMLQEVMRRQAVNQSDMCDSTVCQVEIGKLVRAQKMTIGQLIKMGSRYIFTLDVVDIQSGAMEFSTKEECYCSDDQVDLLASAVAAKVRNYFGESVPIPALPKSAPPREQAPPSMPSQSYLMTESRAPQPGEYYPPGTRAGPMVFVTNFNFYIDKYEVINQDYQECVAAGICRENEKSKGFTAPGQPVVGVDQNDAQAFCGWAGKRLPTEAEWQKAAQGTDGRKYPWGNGAPNCKLANYSECKLGKTWPVGSRPAGASPYGAMDMVGNVREWVAAKGILRGGAWNNGEGNVSISARDTYKPDNRHNFFGIRCARN